MKPKIMYDIIGCGSVVKLYHSKALLALKNDFEINGCFDKHRENSKFISQIFNCRNFTSIEDIKNSQSSALLIATPPGLHFEQIMYGLENNKHIFCEKPFVGTYEEAMKCISYAARNNLVLNVGHFRRLFPSLLIAREFMKNNRNDLIEIIAQEGFRYDWPVLSDYVIKDKYGGVIYDTGSHVLDSILYVLSIDNSSMDYKIISLSKYPTSEPSHEIKCTIKFIISDQEVKLKLYLSRYKPLLNITIYKFTNFEIWVSNRFSEHINLKTKSSIFKIPYFSRGRFSCKNIMDCFIFEHLIFKSQITNNKDIGKDMVSILDATNFLNLTRIMEELSTK